MPARLTGKVHVEQLVDVKLEQSLKQENFMLVFFNLIYFELHIVLSHTK